MVTPTQYFVPSSDQVTSIVLPTILFFIGIVAAMLLGINKCKQWELDKVVEMRRTRRVIQRITTRLREKNFKTIERARNLRKRAAASKKENEVNLNAPPIYNNNNNNNNNSTGASPPPTYEDVLLDEYYKECLPRQKRKY
uniref:Uncharacterized protein n=1 Tax=Strongyloides papillosus TaxID=174720 RepID=A0A0N5CDJ4_STREA